MFLYIVLMHSEAEDKIALSHLGGMLASGITFLGSSRANSIASTTLICAMMGNSAVLWTEIEDFSIM